MFTFPPKKLFQLFLQLSAHVPLSRFANQDKIPYYKAVQQTIFSKNSRSAAVIKTIILFPSDYFNTKLIDSQYQAEYDEVRKIPEFVILFYNHDALVNDDELKFYPALNEIGYSGMCIARTWMLNLVQYAKLETKLAEYGIRLINSVREYENLHYFNRVYQDIKNFTPRALFYSSISEADANEINNSFGRFMIKDYVKSVKGYDFPAYINTPVTQEELNNLMTCFVELRGSLYTGGIVFKDYVNLKRCGKATNEFRVFYLYGKVVTVSKNSNQPANSAYLPMAFAERFGNLRSNFYTVDFAQTTGGDFIVLETGDGQVSGLSPGQLVFKYYDEIRAIVCEPNERDKILLNTNQTH